MILCAPISVLYVGPHVHMCSLTYMYVFYTPTFIHVLILRALISVLYICVSVYTGVAVCMGRALTYICFLLRIYVFSLYTYINPCYDSMRAYIYVSVYTGVIMCVRRAVLRQTACARCDYISVLSTEYVLPLYVVSMCYVRLHALGVTIYLFSQLKYILFEYDVSTEYVLSMFFACEAGHYGMYQV